MEAWKTGRIDLLKPEQFTPVLSLYNHAWNTLGALIRSLREKQLDGTWDCTCRIEEDSIAYDVD